LVPSLFQISFSAPFLWRLSSGSAALLRRKDGEIANVPAVRRAEQTEDK